jgi:hypothetical protein
MRRKLALLIAVMFFAAHAVATAQPPKKTGDGSGTANTAQPDKRGTQESPLVVDTRSIHSAEESAEEANKNAEQKHVNRWNIGLTFAIAICAFLQFCGIAGQIVVYLKQTKLMRDTLTAISGQATTMDGQLTEMKLQREQTVFAMGKQAYEMGEQTSTLYSSLQVAKEAAEAAKGSADAAKASVDLIVQKERPILRIVISPLNMTVSPIDVQVRFDIHYYGSTEAFIVESRATMKVTDSEKCPAETRFAMRMIGLPDVITSQTPVTNLEGRLMHIFPQDEIERINRGELFVHLFGSINYRDRFDRGVYVADFKKIWSVTGLKNLDGSPFNMWKDGQN